MRRYHVTTFGCQMNAHDTERMRGLLEDLGLGESPSPEDADVLVFNTCTIREKPDQRLAAYLGNARAKKARDPDTVVAVGGCYAEAQRDRIFEQYPFVDIAFGPGTIRHLGDWLGAGFGVARSAFGNHDERRFSAVLPSRRERVFQAWVQISMGCNSACSYCIVPTVRGREVSRRPGEILAEITMLARDGVREVTLLGQNVNSWADMPGRPADFMTCFERSSSGGHRASLHGTPKGLQTPCDRRHGRVCRRLRAHSPAAPVGLQRRSQAHAANVRPRALPPPGRATARLDPGHRADDGHHRRLPRRDRGGVRADAHRRG
jgi:hypothetical protein